MSVIETVNISQRLGERNVLDNINLRIERGEIFALIGSTGAGKTTLLRLIDLLDAPTSGSVYFNGIDTAKSAAEKFKARRRMAFVLQKPVVFNTSIYQNIAYGLKWRGMAKDEIRERVDKILAEVDLIADRNRNARTLSGGEMQRIAIARAIALEPEVLLLDEPTANLDPVSTSKIEELIRAIGHRRDITILMATHDMSQGQRLADRVGVLLNGRILQTGDWMEVFNSPVNREVAHFTGVENIIDGVIISSEGSAVSIDTGSGIIEAISGYTAGEKVSGCVRPEDITLSISRVSSSARNSFSGEVTRVISTGPLARVELDCGFPLVCLVTKRSAEEMSLGKSSRVHAAFKATAVHVIRREDA